MCTCIYIGITTKQVFNLVFNLTSHNLEYINTNLDLFCKLCYCLKVFLATFEQRLKEEFIQKCFSDIQDSDRCRLYNLKKLKLCFNVKVI